jgi:hypothetical protein
MSIQEILTFFPIFEQLSGRKYLTDDHHMSWIVAWRDIQFNETK